jgi:hypothetical protein
MTHFFAVSYSNQQDARNFSTTPCSVPCTYRVLCNSLTTTRRYASCLNLSHGDTQQVLARHFIVLIKKQQNVLRVYAADTPYFHKWLVSLVTSLSTYSYASNPPRYSFTLTSSGVPRNFFRGGGGVNKIILQRTYITGIGGR